MHRAALAVTVAVALSACNSHRYYAEAIQYHALATSVLVSRGVCASSQDCQRRQLAFFEAGEFSLGVVAWGGVYINLYSISDEALVQETTLAFRELHGRLKQPKVVLTVYSSAHGVAKVLFRQVVIK